MLFSEIQHLQYLAQSLTYSSDSYPSSPRALAGQPQFLLFLLGIRKEKVWLSRSWLDLNLFWGFVILPGLRDGAAGLGSDTPSEGVGLVSLGFP